MSFRVGDLVSLRVDAHRVGPVIEILPMIAGVDRYRVFHEADHIMEYAEDQLLAVGLSETNKFGVLGPCLLAPDEFRARLTAARLEHPRTEDLYALTAARIQFIPFQFRPLLRLLRAEQPRLLIADEVGVGKTIEAGLILKELSARSAMDNVLVVCPKALTIKWQKEMRRFDEDFRILDGQSLKYCLKETHADGSWPQEYSRSIVHYELLRTESHLIGDERRRWPGLLELDPPPAFDLVIADEAHHFRTLGTNSHQLAEYLGQISRAYVLLSATPVQLGSGDLFSLLNMLKPDVFNSRDLFSQMLEPNAFLTRSSRHLRHPDSGTAWIRSALEQLELAVSTPWGQRTLLSDPGVHRVREALTGEAVRDDDIRVRCLRDVEDLNTLSHVMNRTRRRDIGRFTVREPRTVKVAFTPAQQAFYERLLSSRRLILETKYPANIVRMILDTLERQASSCLPALGPVIERMVAAGKLSESLVSDAPEVDDEAVPLESSLGAELAGIMRAANALPAEDPKFDQLMRVIEEAREGHGPGKLLLFSFFLHTIAYLESRLLALGLRVAVVTGKVPDEEREFLRERFGRPRTDETAIDVLLSSEVGCEGLDYQFCDRLVNYDIPWNPMRIEQRIGRIDRFGQLSDKVLIFNFITPGTVEERIFFRCWERLGIFQDAIGDMEGVLGEAVDNLTKLALDPALTKEQCAERAQQLADNVLRRAAEEERLEEESADLLDMAPWLSSDIQELSAEGRLVPPPDVEHLVRTFLATTEVGGDIQAVVGYPRRRRLRVSREGRSVLSKHLHDLPRSKDRTALEILRWLDGPDAHLSVTFDQAEALENRSLPFITPLHPLVRAAVKVLHRTSPVVLSTHVSAQIPNLAPGTYVFRLDTWETVAVRSEVKTSAAVVCLTPSGDADTLERGLIAALASAKPAVNDLPDEEALGHAVGELDDRVDRKRRREVKRVADENAVLLQRKIASLEAHHEAQISALDLQLLTAGNERIHRMRTAQRRRAQRDYEERRQQLESRAEVDVISSRLSVGVIEVTNAQ